MPPTHTYPRSWHWLLRGTALLLLLTVAGQAAWHWLRAAITLLDARRPLAWAGPWRLDGPLLPMLLASLVLLALALGVALVLANALAPLTLSQQGLYVHGWGRVRFVPWGAIESFFGTRLGAAGRALLFVRTPHAPWYTRLHGWLVGAGFTPGVLVTSDLSNFGPVMGHALRTLESEHGGVGPRFVEQPAPPWLMVIAAPHERVAWLWPLDEQGAPVRGAVDERALPRAAQVMGGVALVWPLLLVVDGLWEAALRPSALLLLLLGLVEWPLSAYWLVALGELCDRSVSWQEMLALYPDTQLPRWVVGAAALVLVLARAPRWLVALPLLAGVAWGGWLLRLLTLRLFNGALPGRGWLGSVVPLVIQGVTVALLLYLMG